MTAEQGRALEARTLTNAAVQSLVDAGTWTPEQANLINSGAIANLPSQAMDELFPPTPTTPNTYEAGAVQAELAGNPGLAVKFRSWDEEQRAGGAGAGLNTDDINAYVQGMIDGVVPPLLAEDTICRGRLSTGERRNAISSRGTLRHRFG